MIRPGESFSRPFARTSRAAGRPRITGPSWLPLKMSANRAGALSYILFMQLVGFACAGSIQNATPLPADLTTKARALFLEEKWDSLLQLLPESPRYPAELDYYRGMALARLEKWPEATQALELGRRKLPADARFPLELARIAFKQKAYARARTLLEDALHLNPADVYSNEFLATIYFLEANLEAALKFWNRTGKPAVVEIRTEPQPRLNPVLLDRAFAFSPASVLDARDYLSTRARLDLLGIFPVYRFELHLRQDQKFDVIFRSIERNGWGNSRFQGLISLFRGLPYQTLHPEFFNLNRVAVNSISMLRLDAQKRRLLTSLSGPLKADPKWRYILHFDGRDENWDVSRTFMGHAVIPGDVKVKTATAGAEVRSAPNGSWSWGSGVSVSHRNFRQTLLEDEAARELFPRGFSLKYTARVDSLFLTFPEHRLTGTVFGTWDQARVFVRSARSYSRFQSGLQFEWFPGSGSENFHLLLRFRAGRTLGPAPFDDLFNLGLDRESDLLMRGHRSTRHFKKGNSPLARDYLLWNWEADKVIRDHHTIQLKLGPFVDTGRAYDASNNFGSAKWLWDIGVQTKVRLLEKASLIFSYGKDLRSGKDAYRITLLR